MNTNEATQMPKPEQETKQYRPVYIKFANAEDKILFVQKLQELDNNGKTQYYDLVRYSKLSQQIKEKREELTIEVNMTDGQIINGLPIMLKNFIQQAGLSIPSESIQIFQPDVAKKYYEGKNLNQPPAG